MPIVAAIPAIVAAGTAVYGASQQRRAAGRAADAQQAAADGAIGEQRRQFDLSRGDQAPWMDAGRNALAQQMALNSGDFSSFTESPDYQFARSQGLDAIDNRAAARGGLFGGGNTRDAMKFASGLASQNYNDFYNRLAGISRTGQVTASGLGSLGANMAGNIGNAMIGAGQARASAYQQQGNANAQLGSALGNAFNNVWGSFYQPSGGSGSSYQPTYFSSGMGSQQQGPIPWGQGPWAGFGGGG